MFEIGTKHTIFSYEWFTKHISSHHVIASNGFSFAGYRVTYSKRRHYFTHQEAELSSKNGRLLNPRKGIYAKLQFNPEELACQIVSPCYLSFEYVLQKAGVVFQYDSRFQLASYLSREIQIGSFSFVFKKLKKEILLNPFGIIQHEILAEATPERAFLDLLYLNKTYFVDQFDKLNKDKLLELSTMYDSKRLTKQINELVHG